MEAFFGTGLAGSLARDGIRADVIIANNVMAHVPDLNDFVEGFERILSDDGLITIENPYVRDLIERGAFDTVYHEHYSYFSCEAVRRLVAAHGLHLNDVEYFPDLHGGTLRWRVGRHDQPTARLSDYLAAERAGGLLDAGHYAEFGRRVEATQAALVELLRDVVAGGSVVAAYGAAAKGATLLNSSGIDGSLISFVVDRNPHKQGLWMPGVRLPILDPSALLERGADYLLSLASNFHAEIMAQQAAFRERGGRFIIPIPSPHVV